MSEIPEDIMKIADNLAACSVGEGIGRDVLSGNIARAILAERSACAKIAEERFSKENVLKNTKGEPYITGGAAIYAATRIAAAIRRR